MSGTRTAEERAREWLYGKRHPVAETEIASLARVIQAARTDAIREAAKAVCTRCEAGDAIFWTGPPRSGYLAHHDNNTSGWPEGMCVANAIYSRFPEALPPSPAKGEANG